MRDDTSVRTFRLSPFSIKFFIVFFLLLLAISAGGVYYSYILYQENQNTLHLYHSSAEMLEQARKELKRLENIEEMMLSFDQQNQESLLAAHEHQEKPDAPEVDLADIFDLVDKNVVSISNVQVSFLDAKMRVQLEINNLLSEEAVAGRIYLFLIRNDGVGMNLDLRNEDLSFAINRFKNIDVTFDIPELLEQEDIFALRVKVEDEEGQILYNKTFPVSHVAI
ncbi:MAG: hypothetical protein ACOCPN_01540 [Desulfonatronovibrionaceae bacterium]